MFLSGLFDRKLENAFNLYGQFIARNAVSAIVFGILVNGLLGVNIRWLTFTKDIKVYTPSNSKAYKDTVQIHERFPDFTDVNFYEQSLTDTGRYGSIIITARGLGNILNATYKDDIHNVLKFVQNISVPYSDGSYSYSKLCAIRNNSCVFLTSILYSNHFWQQVATSNIKYPYFTKEDGSNELLNNTLGGVRLNNEGIVIDAKALKIMFFLQQGNEPYKSLARKWEDEFIKTLKSYNNHNINIAFSNSDSLGQELDANTEGDIEYFSLSFTLMITYASFVSSGGNCVSQRGHLGRAGVIATALAILGAFGIGGALGVEFVNIVGVMPFLILGIGMDDMFILMSSHSDAPLKASVEKRIGKTVETSGVAVTITSFTNIAAFTVGALSSFKSVRNFCIYTGLAVTMCYINYMTFFLGCMAIHERRVAASRHCMTCLVVDKSHNMKENASCCRICCCTGGPPSSRNEQESLLQKLPSYFIPKLVLWLPMKIFVILCFIAYTGFSIWGCINLKQGLTLRNLVSQTSYYQPFNQLDYDYFPSTFIVSIAFPPNLEYVRTENQEKINTLMAQLKDLAEVNNDFEINWLNEYKMSGFYNNSSSYNFCKNLKAFLKLQPKYKNDLILGSDCSIIYSRIHLLTNSIKESYDQGQMMLNIRKVIDNFFPSSFAFSPMFIFFEQYVAVLPSTLQTVGISVASVFLVTCIFLSHPFLIILVTLSMASIMTGLFGFMYFWGLSLSSITMIHIIMSVGFSVDYSVHICHAFLISDGDDRNARVNEAVIRSSGPIFNGAVSSLIGIITVAFSESYVFTSFFKIMISVVLFGLLQAMLFLPVFLSIIGPNRKKVIERKAIYVKEEGGVTNSGFKF